MDILTERTTRRTLYRAIISSLGALIAAALAIPASLYLLIKPKNREADWVEIADVRQLGIGGQVVEKSATWVVLTKENRVIAFVPFCTHLGCAYHWENATNSFVCPCHMSVFAMDGKVMNGPAARPLDRYACRVEAGKILIGSQAERSNA